MAIQFYCSGCGQAIEVDDEYAKRLIACPFCHATVEAPAASALIRPQAVPSTPALPGTFVGSPPPLGHSLTPAIPVRNPAWLCTLGFICGLALPLNSCLGLVLFASQSGFVPKLKDLQERQKADTPAQQAMLLEELQKWPKEHPGTNALVTILMFGLVIGGLSTSIAGLIKARTRKWQAIVGLVLCGLCGSCLAIQIIGGAGLMGARGGS